MSKAPKVSWKFDTRDFSKWVEKATAVPKRAASLLLVEGEVIMTDAKMRTPVDTGTLRASGMTTLVDKGSTPKVELSFGGAAGAYAIYVHERLDVYHPVGEAKFLENAVNAWAQDGGWVRLGKSLMDDVA